MRSLLVLVLLAAACPATTTTGDPPTKTTTKAKPAVPERLEMQRGVVVVQTATGPQRIRVELALKGNERERGLMYREHLDDDEGMLFVFEKQQALSFWMKNTYIPLDMFFIAEDFTIAGIVENAEPLTTSSRRVDKPSRYVLELKGGAARKLGIVAGSSVTFEGVPLELLTTTTTTKEKP
ncbi:MAG: DUF192 domain-containing protein [Deltaproteobacteria bacterium]|nr:DUF192 domain-containing protein [Deltaproteobacteria bacterium]